MAMTANRAVQTLMALTIVVLFVWLYVTRSSPGNQPASIQSSVEHIRSLGKLVVLQAVLQQVVTKEIKVDDKGWELGTPKKALFIVKVDVDFSYDLKNGPFNVSIDSDQNAVIEMPPINVSRSIKDITIYDKRDGSWWGFSQPLSPNEDNAALKEAQEAAKKQLGELVTDYKAQYENSAELTMTMLAKAFGCKSIKMKFAEGGEIVR